MATTQTCQTFESLNTKTENERPRLTHFERHSVVFYSFHVNQGQFQVCNKGMPLCSSVKKATVKSFNFFFFN